MGYLGAQGPLRPEITPRASQKHSSGAPRGPQVLRTSPSRLPGTVPKPCRNRVETVSKPCRNRVETVSKPCRNHVETVSKRCRNRAESVSKQCRHCVETTRGFSQATWACHNRLGQFQSVPTCHFPVPSQASGSPKGSAHSADPCQVVSQAYKAL